MSLRGTLNNIGSGSSQAASSDGKLLKLVSKNDDTKSALFPTNDPLRFKLHSSQQQQQHAASSESSSELKLLRRLTLTNSKEEEQWGDGDDDDDFASSATNEAPLLVKGTAGGSDDVKLLDNNETTNENENDIEKIDGGTDDKVVVEESTQVEEEEFQNNTTVVADEEVMAASLMNVTNNGGSGDDDDEFTIDIASTTNNGNNNSTTDQLVENEGMKASSDVKDSGEQQLTAPPSSTTSMLDLSSFTQATTLCQDDPTFIHPVYNQTCVDLVGEDESKCEVDYSEVRVVDNSDGVEEGEKMLKVKDVCKRSCGRCDDADDIDTVTELEELKLDEEEMEQLLKDSSSKQGTNNETMVVDEEGVQEEEEDNESADENVDKKNASGIDTVEEGALAVKMADEDDAFIPDEEVVEVAVGGKGGIEEDLDSTGTGDEVKEEDNEEEAVSVTDENDDQQLEEETESKAEIALDEGTDDEEMAEKLEEEIEEALDEELVQPKEEGEEIEAASETEDESVLCQDDPEFEYKGYEGFNCAYIKEKKPDKCDKKHQGVKVGLSSCPVSCDMMDECMALQKQKNDVVVSSADETTTAKSAEAIADEQVSEDHSDDSATEQKDDLQLEKEMESELETALEQGTVDEETAEILDEEMLEALEEGVGGVFEKELEEELGLDGQEVSDDLSKEKTATEVDDDNNLATIDSSFTEDASSVVANVTISEDDSSVCQDDPDFKFKGYEGFNCEYIKENKPGKCNKMFDGEKVGVVSCPVSCDMVDECMALRESKVDDALENATDNNVMGSNTTSEEDAVLTNTTAEASDDTNDQLLEGSEDTQVGAVLNTTEIVTLEEEAVAIEAGTEEEEDLSEELLKEQNITSSDEQTYETNETDVLCQDDPDFKFKGYEGFNCEYIKENKPEKCNKMFDGEKVGVVSCPVSCGMVDECIALQDSKVDDALENVLENNETLSNTTSEEDAVLTNTTAKEIADEGTENTDALEGTEDDEDSDDTKAQLVEGSGDTQVDAAGNTTEVVTSKEEAVVTEQTDTETEDDGSEELLDEQNTEYSEKDSNETDETTVLCQDDPDFKFKGYEDFNCEYIKENKPEKCNKLHDGEKVGVVSCPVSCDMVDECMSLQDSKVGAALEHALDNNETLSNTTSEEDVVVTNTTAKEIADEGTENTDALEGREDDEASDDTNDQLLVEGSEDTQVGAVLNTTEVVTSETETETSEELLKEQNTTSVDYSQATTIPSETQQVDDETGEDQILNDQELEQEIEAKLEKALEDGELDEEEAQELEYEMEEAIEEGVGKIFEAELDKELRCKDDPDFAIVDEDGQLRNCSWVRPNQRCESVHEYSGKVIGTFFCPETCGMEDECEKVTAANSTLQAPEDKTSGAEGDDSFEATPKGTKSMADEIEIESEFETGNVYGSENFETFSGGDAEAGSFTNQNEYNQEPNSNVGYSQPTNGVEDWQGYGGENQQEGGSFDNNPPPIDYDENWLEDGSGFPFGFLILLLFLGVGFFIFRKSQSSRLQENSRGGYQRVGRRIDIQDHNKRY